jgi:hypothetical protein
MSFPIDYEADYVEERSRLTTFFRALMVIPQWLLGIILGIAAIFTWIAAWLVVVFTAQYPAGLYNFNAGIVRWGTRVNSYYLLATDAYPPFSIGEEDTYPVRLRIAGPLPKYSRLHAFFRGITMIPSYIVAMVLVLVSEVGALCAWFMIVFTGRTSSGLQNLINLGLAYSAKFHGYAFLLTEDWFPQISDDPNSAGALQAGGSAEEAPAVRSKTTES